MDLVFLHGPVAVGKLTVARELSAVTGIPVFHNHLIVDALTAVFPFGSASFRTLREEWWLRVFGEAARSGTSLIFTFAPEATVGHGFAGDVTRVVGAAGGRVLFVRLHCERAALEGRVADASRAEFGKLTSLNQWRELERAGAFEYPPLPDSGLAIDTTIVSPRAAALRIREHFSLPQAGVPA